MYKMNRNDALYTCGHWNEPRGFDGIFMCIVICVCVSDSIPGEPAEGV